jgi:hypothetical protein
MKVRRISLQESIHQSIFMFGVINVSQMQQFNELVDDAEMHKGGGKKGCYAP